MQKNQPFVLVTRTIPEIGRKILSNYCKIEVLGHNPPSRKHLLDKVEKADAILCLLTERIDKDVFDIARKLKVVSTMSSGVDHIDVIESTKRGIYVTNTPDVLTDATADLTWALILTVSRRIVEADNFVRNGKWSIPWSPTLLLGSNVFGKILGIIGMGRIGLAVAKRAKGFGMKIQYYSRNRLKKSYENELDADYISLDELLSTSDYITIHAPLSKETHHLINKDRIRKMKYSAFLINTSRGSIVDENSLVQALEKHWIKGAALDVFEKEPIHKKNPLLKLNNIILTPHIGSATNQTRSIMAEIAATNLIESLSGRIPKYLVNHKVLKQCSPEEIKMI